MTGDYLELLIIAVIVLGIGVAIWKGGSANPESTGTLGKQVNGLSSKVTTLGTRMGHVEQELDDIKLAAVSRADLAGLEGRITALAAQVKGDRDLAERTFRSVERIERMILERGLNK